MHLLLGATFLLGTFVYPVGLPVSPASIPNAESSCQQRSSDPFPGLEDVIASTGGGTVKKVGDKVMLGGAVCGETLQFQVSGSAIVRIEYWFPWGKAPCGVWTAGSGGLTIGMGCTGGATCITGDKSGTVYAVGVSGSFPASISYHTP